MRMIGAAWVGTRVLLVWAALSSWYGTGTGAIRPWSDVELYADYAGRVLGGAVPYLEVPIEYPVGSLAMILGPGLLDRVPGVTYLGAFVAVALLLDLAGLLALQRLGRRWRSDLGAWTWVGGLTLLGPLVLVRLDLLPVVAVLWAMERASAGAWRTTGGLLAFGAAAKLWPGGLLPAAVVASPRRRDPVTGTVVVLVGVLVTAGGVLGGMLDTAVFRNLGRGLQVESLWGSVLLVIDALGGPAATLTFAHGADSITATGSGVLLWAARLVPVLVLVVGAWLALGPPRRAADRRLAHAAEAATLVLVAGASVLSAQFVLWAVGAVAVAACSAESRTVPRRVALVGAACVLTAVEFPWLYEAVKDGAPAAVALLVLRNALLVTAAIDAIRDARRSPAGSSG